MEHLTPWALTLFGVAICAYHLYSVNKLRKGDKVLYTDLYDSHRAIYIRKLPKNKCEIRLKDSYEIVPIKNIIKL
jgi:16S rRNA U1498 N3-methylase RsmE